jgi:hypothetical protein
VIKQTVLQNSEHMLSDIGRLTGIIMLNPSCLKEATLKLHFFALKAAFERVASFIAVEGTHTRSKYRMKLLIACGINAKTVGQTAQQVMVRSMSKFNVELALYNQRIQRAQVAYQRMQEQIASELIL